MLGKSLDQLLDAEESVVVRRGREVHHLGRAALQIALFWLALWLATILVFAWLGQDGGGLATAFLIALPLLLGAAWLLHGEVVITDKRLLYDRGAAALLWQGPRHFTVPLADISGLEVLAPSSDGLILRHGADQHLVIDGLGDPWKLAAALSTAAGLPAPAKPARITRRVAGLLREAGTVGALVGGLFLLVLTAALSDPSGTTAGGRLAFWLLILPVLPLGVGALLGWLSASILVLWYLRHRSDVTPDELMNALGAVEGVDPALPLARWEARLAGALRHLAGLVYGGTIEADEA